MPRYNLNDIGFKDFSVDEKRTSLVLMDVMMKKLHERNYKVDKVSADKIYYEDGYYNFDDSSLSTITAYNSLSREEAIFTNVLELANLAFCSYLPDYNLKNGLLNQEVLANNFDNYSINIPEEDRNYYKEILVNSYRNKKITLESPYFYDYVLKHQNTNKDGNKKGNPAYVKATEVGRLIAREENEAAFSHNFFLIAAVVSFCLTFAGVLLLFLVNFG